MEQLSNLDVVILIIIALSALLAFYRGLIKEVLSIIGWILMTVIMIYGLPYATPFFSQYVESGFMAGVAASVTIFVVFFILWFFITTILTGKIRSSKKLNIVDRTLGLFFGVLRACLLIVLIYIAVGWVVPIEDQPEFLTKSKYYKIAGTFAEPIEKLLPKKTLDLIKSHKDNTQKQEETNAEQGDLIQGNLDELFEKLAQPKVSLKKEAGKDEKKSVETGYEKSERNNMDRLIDNISDRLIENVMQNKESEMPANISE